ncbi:MAG: hypothetical protein H0X66_07080 [Verrucomicrobia bacterium]|nr:hypothetical protein [Verrucomicrobiota bacterium]
MWIKRTEIEMVEQRKRQGRKRLKEAIAGGAIVLLIVTFLFDWQEAGERSRFFISIQELLSRLPLAGIIAVVSGFVIYKLERRQLPMMICPRCETTKIEDETDQCSCGEQFEVMETLKQVKTVTPAASAAIQGKAHPRQPNSDGSAERK